ncbi:MAG: Bax inhibitor-1/YccA family protein [Myxococcaceae bacterium]
MAWETPGVQPLGQSASQVLMEESARTFMARVYRWMFAGLAITGAAAVFTATSPALMEFAFNMRWVLFGAELALVLGLSWAAPRLSGAVAGLLFIAYAAMNGLLFSFLFFMYELGSIGQAFFLTAGVFGALSVYGTVTKKNLSAWRTFLFMGLIGVVAAGVLQMFVQSSGLGFVWSCACVVVFAGLTAYDTQKLRQYHASSGYSSAASLSIVGALILYLDFVNLFLALLRLIGRRR